MSEEIKDREERFANNPLYTRGGLALEKPYKHFPTDTSIEAMEKWRKEENDRIEDQQINKILRLAGQFVFYITKDDLFKVQPQPMPKELIKAKDSMPVYQVKNLLEDFKRCKDLLRRTTNQYAIWLSEGEKEFQEKNETSITFEPPMGGSHTWFYHGEQWNKIKKEFADKIMITEEAEAKYYDVLILAFEQELKDRVNPEKVKELIVSANKLIKEHKQLAQKVTKAEKEFAETPNTRAKTSKTFMEGRMKLSLLEDDLNILSKKFDHYETSPETKFPSLANEVTSAELHYYQYGMGNGKRIVKEIQDFYKKEIERREVASKKA